MEEKAGQAVNLPARDGIGHHKTDLFQIHRVHKQLVEIISRNIWAIVR